MAAITIGLTDILLLAELLHAAKKVDTHFEGKHSTSCDTHAFTPGVCTCGLPELHRAVSEIREKTTL